MILGLSAVGAVVSLFLIPLLTERPDGVRKPVTSPGGESVIAKSPARVVIPEVAPSIPAAPEPQAPPPPPEQAEFSPAEPPAANSLDAAGLPPGMAVSGPGFALPAMPAPPQEPAAQAPFPQGVAAPLPPLPDRTPEAPETAEAEPRLRGALPWQSDDAGTAGNQDMASLPPRDSGPVEPPARSDIRGWARSAAREFVGGVDADGMPLYRFDMWLDAPQEVRAQIRSVTYEYRAPSAKPPAQSSTDTGSGFRVKFGAAACAEKATITLVMKDGQERIAEVNGCRILN